MQYWTLSRRLLLPVLIMLTGCAGSRVEFDRSTQFEILFYWGVEGRNRFDSISGTLTKDMVTEPPITVKLRLSPAEQAQIGAWADSLGFFELPVYTAPPDTSEMRITRTPCSEYLLRLVIGERTHAVYWTTCDETACAECDRANALGRLIGKLLMAREEYKRLPKPQGGYL